MAGRRALERLIAPAGLLALAVALWMPFGLRTTGLIEEWSFYAAFDQDPAALRTPGQPTRPFLRLGWALGYWLTPDSFVGLNVVNILLFLAKGLLLYGILRRLFPERAVFAFLTAALFVVYPADTALFNLRVTNYHAVVFLYLLSVYLMIRCWHRPAIPTLLAMGAALLLCLGTNEVAYPLVLCTPLLLRWQGDVTRRPLRVAGLWYLIAGVAVAWTLAVLRSGSEKLYPAVLLNHEAMSGIARPGPYVQAMSHAYLRHFVEGWADAASRIDRGSPYLYIALAVAVFIGLVGGWFARTAGDSTSTRGLKIDVLGVVAGLVILGLGFLPFLPLPGHRISNERVFLLSSVGAALSLSSLVRLISGVLPLPQIVFMAVMSGLIGLATIGALSRHGEIVDYSLRQQRILAGFATEAPHIADHTMILLLDPFEQFPTTQWLFAAANGSVSGAVRYLYRNASLRTFLCYPDGRTLGTYREGCQLRSDGVVIKSSGRESSAIPYERVVALRYEESGRVSLLSRLPDEYLQERSAQGYDPLRLVRREAPPPPRVHTLLTAWPFNIPERSPKARASVRFQFDRPAPGHGWFDPEGSITWTSAPRSTLDFRLIPDWDYSVSFRIAGVIAADVLASLRLSVNEQRVELWSQPDEIGGIRFWSRIPLATVALDRAKTRLTFSVDRVVALNVLGLSDDQRRLGLAFDWLRITPVKSPP